MPADEDDEFDWDEETDDTWEEDEELTVPCPACGTEIYEDAPQCPVCGEYVTRSSGRVWEGKPVWYILLGLLGILAVTLVLLVAR